MAGPRQGHRTGPAGPRPPGSPAAELSRFVAMVFLGGYRLIAAASDHSSRLRLDGYISVGFVLERSGRKPPLPVSDPAPQTSPLSVGEPRFDFMLRRLAGHGADQGGCRCAPGVPPPPRGVARRHPWAQWGAWVGVQPAEVRCIRGGVAVNRSTLADPSSTERPDGRRTPAQADADERIQTQ